MAHNKLRRGEQNIGELLVFGYSCKLFRDDEKALYIDQGKHLIPWMGDDAVKIDRYDGRGALYDLKQHEPVAGGYDALMSLTNEERKIEQMCDAERYYALNTNEDVDLLYQEEELKRIQQASKDKKYGQVGFTYDDNDDNSNSDLQENKSDETEEDDVFRPDMVPAQLDMPINTVLPTSQKLFAIIEKTALFIHSQGAQMEILLKMKQASNPQFGFLSFDNPLYPFYRHVLSAIQSGRYTPTSREEKKTNSVDHNSSGDQDDYLHPSLQVPTVVSLPESAPTVPNIAYKPSEHCSYSMLINKIREKQTILPLLGLGDKDTSSQSSSSNNSRSNSPVAINNDAPVHPDTSATVAEPNSTVVVSSAAEYYNPEDVGSDSDQNDDSEKGQEEVDDCILGDGSVVKEESPEVLIPADIELKKIIDKLVVYVAKNGRDFEIVVKRKCDPRFSFLEPGDVHNPYYEQELTKLLPNTNHVQESEDKAQKQSTAGGVLRFSIKKPAKAPTVLDRPALDQEEEDQDEDSDSPPTPPPPPIISTPNPIVENSGQLNSNHHSHAAVDTPTITSNGNTNNISISDTVTTPIAPAPPIISIENGDEEKKKVERKRRAEMFLKRLQQMNSSGATGPPPHVINVPDSSDDQEEAPPPPDLKAKLKALRTRSQSPGSLVKAPPPPKIRRKHHHHHHKSSSSSHHKRKSRSRSRTSSSSSTEDDVDQKIKKHISSTSSHRRRSHRKHRDAAGSRSPSSPSPKRRKKDHHRSSVKSSAKKHSKKKSSRNRSSSPESKKSKKSSHHHHKRKKSTDRSSKSQHSSVSKSGKKKKRTKSRSRSEPSSESSDSD